MRASVELMMRSPAPVRMSQSPLVMAVASMMRLPVMALPRAIVWRDTSAVVMWMMPPAAVLVRSPCSAVMVKSLLPPMTS